MPYVDGDFSTPREILGSGVRQFSEFNNTDFILTRDYVQSRATYAKLDLSTADATYTTAYLVNETVTKRDGYLVWFTRTYATIPTTRTERRSVAYTFPGQSGTVDLGGGVSTWNPYAAGAPSSLIRQGLVELSYSLGEPTVALPTQFTYDGAPVDFVGTVYQVLSDGTIGALLGSTSPASMPSSFVVSDVARRWRGNIWEREKITVGLTLSMG